MLFPLVFQIEQGGIPMRIALTGNPNSGKTTMYNALTGQSEKVGNWAGVTVERKEHAVRKAYANGHDEFYVEYELPFRIGEDEAENERNLQELWAGLKECFDFLATNNYWK